MKRQRMILTMVGIVLALGMGIVFGQNVKNYITQGGALSVIGGKLQVVSGGTLQVDTGSTATIGGATVTPAAAALTVAVAGSSIVQDATGWRPALQTTQTIANGGIIAADSCGGVKLVTAAGAVSTSSTNAFTAPAAGNTGCKMKVCNTGANTITIVRSTNTKTTTGAELALAQNGCVDYLSTGTFWLQTAVMTTSS